MPQDRVPPNDLDAEAAILSTVLLDEDARAEVFNLTRPEHFYSDANRRIYDAMIGLFGRGQPIDILTVRSALDDAGHLQRIGGARYLVEILDSVPSTAHVRAYCERIKDKWKLRQLISAGQRLVAEAYFHPGEAQPMLDQAEATVAGIARGDTDRDLVPLREAVLSAVALMDQARENGGRRFGAPTGFTKLDELTGGWMNTDLIILAARPGMGKTAWALCSAIANARSTCGVFGEEPAPNGNAVAFFSLEMPKEQLAMRLLCQEARIDLNLARQGKIPRDRAGAMTKAANDLFGLPFDIDDTPGLGVLEMRAKLQRAKAKARRDGRRLSLAVVDYLQIMKHQDPTVKSRVEAVGSIARDLKRTARECNVPVMALSQLNRGPEEGKGRRPVISDLRESGELEQEADVVVFLYRESYYDRESEDETCEAIVAKQRNGPTGIARLKWTPQFTRFDNLERDEPDW